MIVSSPSPEEFRIITVNQNVIMDMIDSSVRILTEGGDIVDCPCKTFMANIHDIRLKILENENYQLTAEDKSKGKEKVNQLIEKINSKKQISQTEFDNMKKEIDLIGEPVISNILKNMLENLDIIN